MFGRKSKDDEPLEMVDVTIFYNYSESKTIRTFITDYDDIISAFISDRSTVCFYDYRASMESGAFTTVKINLEDACAVVHEYVKES